MTKIIIKVCPICKKEDCLSKIYETEDMYSNYGYHVGKIKICSSDNNLIKTKNGFKYKLVSGHGTYSYYNVKEIK